MLVCTDDAPIDEVDAPVHLPSLIGLLFWIGYRRTLVPFDRLQRSTGKSGWSLRRRYRYLLDSLFSFTDLPIRPRERTEAEQDATLI